MTYREFRAIVEEMMDDIPDTFLQGLQGVHALEQEQPEEGYVDVWRMGEYLDPGPEDFLGGFEGLGRHVALYYGSFARIAEGDPDFDWEAEIWETLTHELRHHVESLAGDGTLIEQDLMDAATFEKRRDADDARDNRRGRGEGSRGGNGGGGGQRRGRGETRGRGGSGRGRGGPN